MNDTYRTTIDKIRETCGLFEQIYSEFTSGNTDNLETKVPKLVGILDYLDSESQNDPHLSYFDVERSIEEEFLPRNDKSGLESLKRSVEGNYTYLDNIMPFKIKEIVSIIGETRENSNRDNLTNMAVFSNLFTNLYYVNEWLIQEIDKCINMIPSQELLRNIDDSNLHQIMGVIFDRGYIQKAEDTYVLKDNSPALSGEIKEEDLDLLQRQGMIHPPTEDERIFLTGKGAHVYRTCIRN